MDTKSDKAIAAKNLEDAQSAPTPLAATEIEPGGKYLVNKVLVNADGEPFGKKKKDE